MPVAEYPVSLVLSTGEPLRGQVTGIIRESGAGAQEFAGAAAQMHLMAEELKRMVTRFNVGEQELAVPTEPRMEEGDVPSYAGLMLSRLSS